MGKSSNQIMRVIILPAESLLSNIIEIKVGGVLKDYFHNGLNIVLFRSYTVDENLSNRVYLASLY